jgi:hypothetical protein
MEHAICTTESTPEDGGVTSIRIRCGNNSYVVRPTFDGRAIMTTDDAAQSADSKPKYDRTEQVFKLTAMVVPGVSITEYFEDSVAADNRKLEINAAAFAAPVSIERVTVGVTAAGEVIVGNATFKVK